MINNPEWLSDEAAVLPALCRVSHLDHRESNGLNSVIVGEPSQGGGVLLGGGGEVLGALLFLQINKEEGG